MKKRKVSAIVAAAVTINLSASLIESLADERLKSDQRLIKSEEAIPVKNVKENIVDKKVPGATTESAIITDVNQEITTQAAATITDINSEIIKETTGASVKATINKFNLLNNSNIGAYNKEFKVDKSNIESITNNGGKYINSTIDKAIDGDLNTHWETGKPNSSNFTNEVVIKLKEETSLNRIVYAARQESAKGKGFAQEVEIYASITDEEDDFTLVSSGEYKGSTGDVVEIKFNPTKFKRIKFVFKRANQNWASAAEFMLYKEDKILDKVDRLFTDDTMSKVSEEFNSIEKINALENEAKGHPLETLFKESFDLARKILSGNGVESGEVITLSQRGDENKQRDQRRQVFAGGNLDLTGKYIMPNESFEVYLDADGISVLPELVFAQVGEVDGSGNYKKSLKVGKNVITAPSGTKAFAIYFSNKALPEEQKYAPRVRVSGEKLNDYPIYIYGKTDVDSYIEKVKSYEGPDMTDVMGERFLISGKNSEAKIAYVDRGKTPLDAVKAFDKFISTFDRLSGYDENDPNPIHRPTKALYHYKGTNASGLFASNEYIHYSGNTARDLFSGNLGNWGIGHEFGHQIENKDMRLGEVTNNLYSIAAQKAMLGYIGRDLTKNQNIIDKYFTFDGTKGFGGFTGDNFELKLGLFERLLVITQITNYFGDEAYSKAARLIRENPSRYSSLGSYQSIIGAMSEATGYDLVPHFEYYNYPVTDKTREFTSQFKLLNKKIRYTTIDTYKKIEDKVQTYSETTKAVINNVKNEADGFTLSLSTNDNNKGTIAYEIYRDGKLVGFNRTGTYKDKVDSSKEYKYEVIAYDYMANQSITSDPFYTKSIIYNPSLNVNDEIDLVLKSDFNALDYVSATTFDGSEIDKSRIKVINNVDTNAKGKYAVTYEVEDRGYTTSKTISVVIYEDLNVKKSMYGQFNNLDKYNEEFKLGVSSVSNNAGSYNASSGIANAIDNNINTHWETSKPNSDSFKNEVIFDLGETKEINRIAYKARNGGKGFAKKFEIYISNEAEGNDFILSGKGEYTGNVNDIVEFKISKTSARRVKFRFIEADRDWASIGEVAFYKEDVLSDKINNLFVDNTKTEVNEQYDTLEKIEALKDEAKNHPAAELFEKDLAKAEDIVRKKPILQFEDITYVKVNSEFDLNSGVTANDRYGNDITKDVKVNSNNFDIGKPGEYVINYTVKDSNNNITSKNRKVIVYINSTYLSDIDWDSAVSGWKTVNKDLAVGSKNKIKLNVNGEIKEFDKGLGALTNTEIIYKLDGNYTNFSTYLGTDKNYDDNQTTIIFKIFADGKEVYTSGVVRKDSKAELVNLDITGVKELKLVADNVDNNTLGDFASWADTKLYNTKEPGDLPGDENTNKPGGDNSGSESGSDGSSNDVSKPGDENTNKPGEDNSDSGSNSGGSSSSGSSSGNSTDDETIKDTVTSSWVRNDDGTWSYIDSNGVRVVSKWIFENQKWYYLDENGIMKTGWYKDNDEKWYYLDIFGDLKTGWFKDTDGKWYYLNNSGVMVTGWFKDTDGKWYYLNNSGVMVTGWFKDTDGKWYYLNESGAMVTGWFKDTDGKWYYLNNSGVMVTGWFKDTDEKWYYLNNSGVMVTGWFKDTDGKWYYLNNSGAMVTGWLEYNNKWYYLNENGDMQSSGWKHLNNKWYYFYANGEMAASN